MVADHQIYMVMCEEMQTCRAVGSSQHRIARIEEDTGAQPQFRWIVIDAQENAAVKVWEWNEISLVARHRRRFHDLRTVFYIDAGRA